MLIMIDNYDSFTYNLVQYFYELGVSVDVYQHDTITIAEIEAKKPRYLVISPGPRSPNEAGISMAAMQYFSDKIPVLGVCLGHQCLAQLFGGQVKHARSVMHGKTSAIHHTQKGIFREIPTPFTATRYHSLIVDKHTLPDCLEVTAWTTDEIGGVDEIMAIQHRELPLYGVQFHPESILTEHGHQLLRNFLYVVMPACAGMTRR